MKTSTPKILASTRCRAFCLRWIPVAVYAGILFYLSSVQHPRVPHFWFSDKIIHVGIYAGFGAVLVRAFDASGAGWTRLRIILVALVGTLAYGTTDEYHQLFVSGRSAEWADLIADGAGGVLGGGCYILASYVERWRRKKIQGDGQTMESL